MHISTLALVAALVALRLVNAAPRSPFPPAPYPSGSALPISSQSTCSGDTYINRGPVAFGTVASNARDKFGDTCHGFGSGTSPDVMTSFVKTSNGSVSESLYASPDRGWNTDGSIDY